HRPVTQTDHTSLVREPGESLIEKFTGADDDTAPRFHAIITDLVGTPTELVTAAGALAWQHRTTLWGTHFPSGASTPTVDCPLRFPGQYADPETGLYYNYFRHYDPETARYITPDPLGLEPAPNHHGYVPDPRTWIDPLGLAGCKDAHVALRGWRNKEYQLGSQHVKLDKKGMKHFLERHHPQYWDGSTKGQQSFFDSKMSVTDVRAAVEDVLKQNRDTINRRGVDKMYQVTGEVDGTTYVLGINRGRVGQFYPLDE
ncbi:RHS repeat-associated core domain-containing protein, partial [Streptomyces asiaticus]